MANKPNPPEVVEGYMSYPVSGPTLLLSESAYQAMIERTTKSAKEGLSMLVMSYSEKDGLSKIKLRVSKSGRFSNSIHSNSGNPKECWRCSFGVSSRLMKLFSESRVPFFGKSPVKIYVEEALESAILGEEGIFCVRIEFDQRNLTTAVSRFRANKTKEKRVETPDVPAKPQSTGAQILLSMAGQDLVFHVPIEEVFNLSLSWVQKGYKQ